MKRIFVFAVSVFISLAVLSNPLIANDKKVNKNDIQLEEVDYSKGKPFLQTLKERKSTRTFLDKELDLTTLSELLWSAGGISREGGYRTFPSAMNAQEIDIYVFTKKGIYLYIPSENLLKFIMEGDKRADTGMQSFAADAAVNLVYSIDLSKMRGNDENQKMLMSAIDLGHVSQNVYLYCASAELACVVRGSVNGKALEKLLNLKDSQKIILAQSVGYKK